MMLNDELFILTTVRPLVLTTDSMTFAGPDGIAITPEKSVSMFKVYSP